MLDALQAREVFHLVFLRALARSIPLSAFVLKGGSNLRFFFDSIRYSEGMDLDAHQLPVATLREKVMAILQSRSIREGLQVYGIANVRPPNVGRAKQIETVQRFKVHLYTRAGQDLATKVEFSRRGLDSPVRVEPIASIVLARYRMPPLVVPHYAALAAIRQKIRAIVSRSHPEPRDIFDLYLLSPRLAGSAEPLNIPSHDLRQARDRVFSVEFEHYRDAVVSYLAPEDWVSYDSPEMWDAIRLQVISLLEDSPQ